MNTHRSSGSIRTALTVLTLVIITTLVAACGGGGSKASGGGTTTVVVWDRAGAQATIKQKWFESWNNGPGQEAGIKVQYEPQAADKYEELVRVAFQTKRGPDVFHTPSSQLGGFVAAGWVQPLDGDLVDAQVLKSAAPYLGKNSELVWDGHPYAIPTTTFTNRLVINRALFSKAGLDPDKPPATLSQLSADAQKIAAVSPGKTYGFAIPSKWVGFRQWIVDLPIMATDTSISNGLFDASTQKYDTAGYAPVISAYRTMIANKSAYPGTATLDQDTAWAAFAKGEVGMVIASSALPAAMDQLDSTVKASAAPLPVPDGTTLARSPMNAGYPFGISALTKNADAAATVVEAMAGDGIQQALAQGDAAPLSDTVWDSSTLADKPLLKSFRPTGTDQQWPKNPNSVVPVEGKTVDQTIVGLVIEPNTPLESTLSDLQQRYQTAYDKAVADKELDPAEFAP